MKRNLLALLLSGLVFLIFGCLSAQKYWDLVYDETTDTFRMLRVYHHINGKGKDIDYLASLYQNRDNVMPMQIVSFLGESAILRVDAKKYYSINLGGSNSKPSAPSDAVVDLSKIINKPGKLGGSNSKPSAPSDAVVDLSKIINKPGKFFVSDDNSLGYYHQIYIPGTTVDEFLVWYSGELRTLMTKAIKTELDRRGSGDPVNTWSAAIDEETKKLSNDDTKNYDPDASNPGDKGQALVTILSPASKGQMPLNILSADSLKLIQKAIDDKQINLARKGSEFTLGIPATAEDRNGFMGLCDAVKNVLRMTVEDANDKQPSFKDYRDIIDVINTLSITNDEKTGQIITTVELTITLRKVLKVFEKRSELFGIDEKVNKDVDSKAISESLVAIKTAGIDVDEKIKLTDILAMFAKGTLPVDKPNKVESGTGLFTESGTETGLLKDSVFKDSVQK